MASKRPPNRIEELPNGVAVEFWDSVGVDGQPQQRRYKVEGEKLVSISTIAGIFDKFGLVPAAATLTAEGVIALAERGVNLVAMTPQELIAALRANGLDYDSVWQQARDRGDLAHDHLLHLIRDGQVANLRDYEADIRPWIAAGMKWFLEAEPQIIDAETIVASTEHGFAGRYDLYAVMRDERRARIDFKTVTEWKVRRDGKGNPTDKLLPPYDENAIQLDGYELAARECGREEADCLMVVRLGPDGDYDVTEVPYHPDCFLAALDAYNERKRIWKPEAVPA